MLSKIERLLIQSSKCYTLMKLKKSGETAKLVNEFKMK